jgi:hypothetical protein
MLVSGFPAAALRRGELILFAQVGNRSQFCWRRLQPPWRRKGLYSPLLAHRRQDAKMVLSSCERVREPMIASCGIKANARAAKWRLPLGAMRALSSVTPANSTRRAADIPGGLVRRRPRPTRGSGVLQNFGGTPCVVVGYNGYYAWVYQSQPGYHGPDGFVGQITGKSYQLGTQGDSKITVTFNVQCAANIQSDCPHQGSRPNPGPPCLRAAVRYTAAHVCRRHW